ncbi:tRNA pseudouridine(13) synthase TruD [Methanococcoides sp. SA1]|nr:tRNA pseudouridine(13) synthase TruD [Methanococcoides sp. SA1]
MQDKIRTQFKESSSDFIVEEIGKTRATKISKEFTPNQTPDLKELDTSIPKNFLWCEMEKKDIEHFQAVKEIARHLHIHPMAIGYAGIKDKKAWTVSRISIESPDLEKIKTFSHPKIILKNFRWNKRKIKIGYLESNHFKINLRDIDKKEAIKVANSLRKLKNFPNFFGPQRFGIEGKNVNSGKLLLKRKFAAAAKNFLADQPFEDPIKTLKTLPRKILLMHVNAVQSKIFNDILEEGLEQGLDFTKKGQQSIPLMGYKTRFSQGRLGKIEQSILKSHNLTLEDFNITEIPHLRMKGSFRTALVEIKDLDIEILEDEKYSGAKKIQIQFTLPKGVYATTFLENFFILNQ